MNFIKKCFLYLVSAAFLFISSCEINDDNQTTSPSPSPPSSEINSFVYRGLNTFYLYKDQQPLLANDFFKTKSELNSFINSQNRPENFFELLTLSKDRFSWIVNDYNDLERSFQGINLSNGMQYNLLRFNKNPNTIFGVVTYVVENSPASNAGVKRGDFFTKINNTQLTKDNYRNLLSLNSYQLGLAEVNNANQIQDKSTVSLTKIELTENPVALSKIIEIENHKIGYLLYNQFISGSEETLNNEFKTFKNAAIQDLVLDLRYNGGGSVSTAIDLLTMITGQFGEEIVLKEKWNNDLQEIFEANGPENLVNRFSKTTSTNKTTLNTLNLTKLYVITSKNRTASSSELIINSLKPYINVVVIGDSEGTVGKSQGSITIYDSPGLSNKKNINPRHTYAMQPLVVKSVNKNDIGVSENGILPNIIATENVKNLGVLGDQNEPLLSKAIEDITGITAPTNTAKSLGQNNTIYVGSDAMDNPTYQRMYIKPIEIF